jgi:hypothetical protein
VISKTDITIIKVSDTYVAGAVVSEAEVEVPEVPEAYVAIASITGSSELTGAQLSGAGWRSP